MVFAAGMDRAETAAEHIERLSMPIPEAGCYAWLGAHSRGYAKMQGGGRKSERVIRVLCEPIPTGLEVDHRCHMRWCVNRDHLDLTTHQVNIQRQRARAVALRQTCEKHGDVLRSYGRIRVCRTCKTEYLRGWRARHKEELQ